MGSLRHGGVEFLHPLPLRSPMAALRSSEVEPQENPLRLARKVEAEMWSSAWMHRAEQRMLPIKTRADQVSSRWGRLAPQYG